jgi:hypothetical protein
MNDLPKYLRPIINTLAMYIEQKVDYFTMQFAGHDYEFGPYVQALHEHGNILLIEAIGNEYLEPPLSEANQQTMLFLGWRFNAASYSLNYSQFIDLTKQSPEEIAIVMVKALYFAYGVDESYEFEIKPALESARLFIENLNQTKEKLMNNEVICSECKNPFQELDKGVSPIKNCAKCVEAMQERMLTAIFGEIKGS